MNLLELLDQEIRNKNWSLEEKCRYLYLRCCELFSYDERYFFYNLLEDGMKRIKETKNRTINLEDVNDNRVICTSHSREILKGVLEELLNRKCTIKGSGHLSVNFNDGSQEINADATNRSDFTRVKMNLKTYGYNPTTPYYDFNLELKERDRKIGYINKNYPDYLFETRSKILYSSFLQQSSSKNISNDSDDFILYQLETVKNLFEEYNFSNFSDNEFSISYLIRKILDDNQERVEEPVKLFQIPNPENWNLINLYPINLKNDRIYFILEQEKNGFCFHQTTREDAKQYTKNFRGNNKHLIY